jgi:hypothetical protein
MMITQLILTNQTKKKVMSQKTMNHLIHQTNTLLINVDGWIYRTKKMKWSHDESFI